MTTIARLAAVGLALLASGSDSAAVARAEARQAFVGACYCRVGETLRCTSDLSELDCRERCDEALCDDWFWKERLPCWNWGYGG